MEINKKSLGIIGIGQFAEFFIPYLKPYFSRIVISSKKDKSEIAKKLGVQFSDIGEASFQDFVMLGMPISEIENVLKKIRSSTKPGSLIVDICSVKSYPTKQMLKLLNNDVNIIGMHPLFGPQSGKNGITGLDLVVCPIRTGSKLLNDTIGLFKDMGLNVIVTTPQEHDMVMAKTQALTHFFAKGVLKTIKDGKFSFSTPSSRKLFSIINDIKDDSNILFRDIETLNPYAKKIREELVNNLSDINKNLQEYDSYVD